MSKQGAKKKPATSTAKKASAKKPATKKTTPSAKKVTTSNSGNNTMIWLVVGTIIACIALSMIFSNTNNNAEFENSFNLITVTDLERLYNANETSIVYIGTPQCPHCAIFEPDLDNVANDFNLVINYLNTDYLDDVDRDKLNGLDPFFTTGWGVPLVIIVGNGELAEEKINGRVDEASIVDYFKAVNKIN